MKKSSILLVFAMLISMSIFANERDSLATEETELTDEQLQEIMEMIAYEAALDSIEQTFKYEKGEIVVGSNLATIKVPEGYQYLNGEQSEMLFTEIWGNPPRSEDNRSLGTLSPSNVSIMSDSSFIIDITYSEDGYIDDSDAKDIDYDELLESMQEDSKASNEYRIEEGYPAIELVGWASSPFYDKENKKLHWAKELRFGDMEESTLNYNIRILGRKGYLQLNAVGGMYVLDEVKREINPILAGVNFNEGSRYSDFNPDIDKVAAYGIGGLIAGKILAKAGILAKIGIFLAKFWKIIAIGVVGLFAGVGKFFGRKGDDSEVEPEA